MVGEFIGTSTLVLCSKRVRRSCTCAAGRTLPATTLSRVGPLHIGELASRLANHRFQFGEVRSSAAVQRRNLVDIQLQLLNLII